MSRPANPDRLWLFAVEDNSVQLTWSALEPGPVTVRAGDNVVELEADGGPGSVVLDDLPPDTSLELVVSGPRVTGGTRAKAFTTLAPPSGRELFRFATISDLHIGEFCFGRRGTIRDTIRGGSSHPYPVRATREALQELATWGAELVVVKGDITSSSRIGQWEMFAKLLAEAGLPVEVITGNHDTGHESTHRRTRRPALPPVDGERVTAEQAFARVGLGRNEPVRAIDVPGLRIVLVETSIAGKHIGHIAAHEAAVVDLLTTAPAAAFVALHHPPMASPVPYFWPPGIPTVEARGFLRQARAANPNLLVSSGHTHRNRRRELAGVPVTEVGSVKDFPGVWAGYVVHEDGIRQVVRRVGAPNVLAWTDTSARAAGGAWGHWSKGALADRCFSLNWPGGR